MAKSKLQKISPVLIIGVVIIIALLVVAAAAVWNNTSQTHNQNVNNDHAQTDAEYLLLADWGVRIKPASGLSDLKALPRTSMVAGADEKMFITSDMLSLGAACNGTADGSRPLGAILRMQSPAAGPTNLKLIKHIGSYYYYYYAPASSCSADPSSEATQSANLTKVKDSLDSLQGY